MSDNDILFLNDIVSRPVNEIKSDKILLGRCDIIFWKQIMSDDGVTFIKNNNILRELYKDKFYEISNNILNRLDKDYVPHLEGLILHILRKGKKNYYDIIAPTNENGEIEVFKVKSKYQNISVYHGDNTKSLYIDDILQFNDKEEHIYHEMMAHVPLTLKSHAQYVLIIGGGDGGVCREVLKHQNVKKIKHIDIDRKVIETCKEYFPEIAGGLNDSRVKFMDIDAFKWVHDEDIIKSYRDRFDVIIIDMTDFGASNPLYTHEFYVALKKLLNPSGVLTLNAGNMEDTTFRTYDIYRMMKRVFTFCRFSQMFLPMYNGHYGSLVCTDYKDPVNWIIQDMDFKDKNIITKYYSPEIHRASLVVPKEISDLCYPHDTITHNLGIHIVLDFICDPRFSYVIDDIDGIKNSFNKAMEGFGLEKVGEVEYKFEPQGVTLVFLLKESHISIHSWPEKNSACIDIFTCRNTIDANAFVWRLVVIFKAIKYSIKYFSRGI
jgi:spermidine synthase